MMKKRLFLLLTVCVTLLIGGCGEHGKETASQDQSAIETNQTDKVSSQSDNNSQDISETEINQNNKFSTQLEDDYDRFIKDYENILENYKLKDFKKTGHGELQHSCTVFPENSFFDEANDMIDDDMNKPVKKNLYFINKDRDVLIYITHIFIKEPVEKHFLTSDAPANEYEGKKTVQLPNFEENYLSYHNTIASIKIFYLGEGREPIEELGIDAVKAYTKILKE